MCKFPDRWELLGAGFVSAGLVSMFLDPKAVRADSVSGGILVYLAVLGSSAFGAVFFMINARNVQKLPPFTLLFAISFYMFFSSCLIAAAQDNRVNIFSNDPVWGCLGFMNSQTWLFCYLVFGLFTSVFFSVGTIMSTLFFSPLVVACAFLLEPFVAQLVGCALGLDNVPGFLTWLGAALAMVGLVFFFLGSRKQEIKEAERKLQSDDFLKV